MKKVIFVASVVKKHINVFHLPYLEWFKNNGFETHVAAKDDFDENDNKTIPYCDVYHNVAFERSPFSLKGIKAYKTIKKIIEENYFDIIHCHTPVASVLTRLAARKARKRGTKVIYTAHGFHFFKGAPLINWLLYYPVEKFLARFTDVLITINKEDYERAKKFKAESVEYIPGVGADTSRFKPCGEEEAMDLKRELGYPENQSILLCIGELNKNKNQEAVIKALSEVIKIVPNTKLLLAGNGPNYKTLMQLADDLGLQKHIDFLGYRTKIEKYISISDVVISASIREGLPMNIVEALLCKKPVVASYNRGHKELVEHGVNGYLVNPNSYKEFSEYILKIIKEKAFDFTYTNDVWLNVKKFADKNVINELAKIYSRFQRGAEY